MAIQCEICGSANLVKQDSVFVCQQCGVQYTVEAIRKMVSEETAPAPAAPSAPEPVKAVDISGLLAKADEEYRAGNTGAAKTFLEHADSTAPDNFEILFRMVDYGFSYDLRKLVELAPSSRKTEITDYAYEKWEIFVMRSLNFSPLTQERFLGPNTRDFLGKTWPSLQIEGFWDETRYLTSFFKGVIRAIEAYELPDALPDGLLADAHLSLCRDSVVAIDKFLSTLDHLIPNDLRGNVHTAFAALSKKIATARWYTTGYRDYSAKRIDKNHVIYFGYLEDIKAVIQKHEAAAYAAKTKQEEERRAAEAAAQKAYWDAHPEELEAHKREQAAKERAKKENRLKEYQSKRESAQKALLPKEIKLQEVLDRYAILKKEGDSLGIFQKKRKKELADARTELIQVQFSLEDEIAKDKQEIDSLTAKIAKLEKELSSHS